MTTTTTTTTTTKTTEEQMIKEYNEALMGLKETTLKASLKVTEQMLIDFEKQYQEFYKEYITGETEDEE